MSSQTPSSQPSDLHTAQAVKVAYRLERNEDGFPPISVELLNAERVSADVFRIKNAPFFAPNVSFGDLVHATPSDVAGQFEFDGLVEASSYTSISIILLDTSMDTFLMDLLRGMNCVLEYGEFGLYRVLAVAVPPASNYASLRSTLTDLEGRELVSFAELSLAH
jgi:hypothetical protein